MRRIGLLAVLAAGLAVAFGRVYRPWHLRWGATDAEVARSLPGDDRLIDPAFAPTRAITIAARPDEIWPWIVQIGYGRAGFYAYDLLDNLGRPSARRIVPELQRTAIGDWIPMSGTTNEATAFRVAAFGYERWMLWTKPDSTWAWSLQPIDAEHTRLVSRIRAAYDWTSPMLPLTLLLMEIGDFPMSRRELLNIRSRAEAMAADRRSRQPATAA
jgi:hypothetical protein